MIFNEPKYVLQSFSGVTLIIFYCLFCNDGAIDFKYLYCLFSVIGLNIKQKGIPSESITYLEVITFDS